MVDRFSKLFLIGVWFRVRKFLDAMPGGSANEVRGNDTKPLKGRKSGGFLVPSATTQNNFLFQAYFWANFPPRASHAKSEELRAMEVLMHERSKRNIFLAGPMSLDLDLTIQTFLSSGFLLLLLPFPQHGWHVAVRT